MNSQTLSFQIQKIIKQVFDVVLAVVCLVLALPFLALIALAVKLDSPGEAIYRHSRIGKGGKPFQLYKFRSMLKGGDDTSYMHYLKQLIESERNGSRTALPYRKMDGDARVTRVGKYLRCFYLDELPQLINVVRGEMSWVGPRPHVQFEVDQYSENQHRRLSVRPGCTGLWQVVGKADCTFNQLIQLDLDYIDQWSLLLDIKIMVKTFLIMLQGGEKIWARKAKTIPASTPVAPVLNPKHQTSPVPYHNPETLFHEDMLIPVTSHPLFTRNVYFDANEMKEEYANENI